MLFNGDLKRNTQWRSIRVVDDGSGFCVDGGSLFDWIFLFEKKMRIGKIVFHLDSSFTNSEFVFLSIAGNLYNNIQKEKWVCK